MKILADIGLAFLIVFTIVLSISLTKEFSLSSIPNAIFVFVFCLVAPFITITIKPIGLLYIALFGVAFALIFRYMPSAYRKYGLAVALTGWEFYGVYCAALID